MRNFNSIAAAVGATLLCTGAYAQSSVTIYGVMDAAMEVSNHGAKTRLVSGGNYGSRLGFRGHEDLGGGLGAVFRLEMGVNLDSGSIAQGGLGFGRESSIGLQSRTWGTVLLGRTPTPLWLSQSATDPFIWMGSGGHLALTRDTATAPQQLLPLTVNARLDNSATYISPVLAGFQFRAQASLSENSATVGSGRSASLKYAAGPVNANVAWESVRAGAGGTGHVKGWTAGGSYDFGIAKVFAGATQEENNCSTCVGALARGPVAAAAASTSSFRLLNVGARVPFGNVTWIGQVTRVQDRSDYFVSPGSRDATWISIGAEYELSKRTFLYASLGTIENRNGSRYALGTGSTQQAAAAWPAGANKRATTSNLGIRHVF